MPRRPDGYGRCGKCKARIARSADGEECPLCRDPSLGIGLREAIQRGSERIRELEAEERRREERVA